MLIMTNRYHRGAPRRSSRNKRKLDYRMADKEGFTQVKRRKRKGKSNEPNNGVPDNTENREQNASGSENTVNTDETVADNNLPSTSNTVPSDMGRGSLSDRDTSDIDSEDLAREEAELERLNSEIAEKEKKRSVKEKQARKRRLAELRKLAEEKRQQLKSLDSDLEEETPAKKRKSKDGRGVKNAPKRSGKEGELSKSATNKRKRAVNRSGKNKGTLSTITKSSSSEVNTSRDSESLDEFEATIQQAKKKNRSKARVKVKKIKNHVKRISSVDRKRSAQESTEEGSSGSSSEESSHSSEFSSSSPESGSEGSRRKNRHTHRKQSKKGKIKSGVKAKPHKIRLKTSELCAQAVLDEEHYPGCYKLEELSFEQLVAGELEICTLGDISKKEKTARLQILKLLAYFSNMLPQTSILEVYKAVILKVEKGLFRWSDDIVKKAESMLDRAVSKARFSTDKKERKKDEKGVIPEKERSKKEQGLPTKQGEKVVYCLDFNKNKCDKETSHEGRLGGKDVWKQHVCRQCLTVEKEKRNHAESDSTCPCKNR